MVGETTAKKYPQDMRELEDDFNRRRLSAKERKQKIAETMLALEKEYAAIEKEETTWEIALDTLRNVGTRSGPKKRISHKQEQSEELGAEEAEAY